MHVSARAGFLKKIFFSETKKLKTKLSETARELCLVN